LGFSLGDHGYHRSNPNPWSRIGSALNPPYTFWVSFRYISLSYHPSTHLPYTRPPFHDMFLVPHPPARCFLKPPPLSCPSPATRVPPPSRPWAQPPQAARGGELPFRDGVQPSCGQDDVLRPGAHGGQGGGGHGARRPGVVAGVRGRRGTVAVVETLVALYERYWPGESRAAAVWEAEGQDSGAGEARTEPPARMPVCRCC
jgi:hypothetical protein